MIERARGGVEETEGGRREREKESERGQKKAQLTNQVRKGHFRRR